MLFCGLVTAAYELLVPVIDLVFDVIFQAESIGFIPESKNRTTGRCLPDELQQARLQATAALDVLENRGVIRRPTLEDRLTLADLEAGSSRSVFSLLSAVDERKHTGGDDESGIAHDFNTLCMLVTDERDKLIGEQRVSFLKSWM